MTLNVLFEKAQGLTEEDRQKFNGRSISINERIAQFYPGLRRLTRARIHTILDRAVQILTEGGEYVTIHPISGRTRAYTMQDFEVKPPRDKHWTLKLVTKL